MPVEETGGEAVQDQASFDATASPASIEVSQLTFGYFPDQPVLRQVSFIVQPGEHVALVGRTGAGKSSIVHLLGGLYAPWQGELRVAGLDPRRLPEHERRRVIGVVPQAVQLFSGTVLDNLTLGDENVPLDAVESAAHTAGADVFIRSLPQGYNTFDQQRIGRRGAAFLRAAPTALAGARPGLESVRPAV